MERALAVLLAGQLAGCSFIGVRGVPPDAPPTLECTESNTLPLLDGVGAGVLGGTGAVAIIANETKSAGAREAWVTNAGLVLIALAIPLAISAWWGFRNVTRCSKARGGP